jgi:periplasmic divalent cation tolerance protein
VIRLPRSTIVTVYATFGSPEEAERIGRQMVERQLAACVNILGSCRSIYRWQGVIEEASEVAALFKTAATQAPTLIEAIAEQHGYDVPAAVVWPIAEALPAYADWVARESLPGKE